MDIEVHCNGCGKLLSFPQGQAGGWRKCPACGGGVYVPLPEEELRELPLAPEDDTDAQREASLQAERRRLDRVLAKEGEGGEASGSATPPSSGHERRITVEDAVIRYLAAMRQSDLSRAEKMLTLLKPHRAEALAALDRLATDYIPPAALADLPTGVYHGFLKTLRAQL